MAKYFSLDGARIALLFLAALAQATAGRAPVWLGWEETIGSRSAAVETPIIPAGYAFSIWGLIFLASFAFILFAAAPSRIDEPRYRRIGWLALALFLLNAGFEIWVPLSGVDMVSMAIIFAALAASIAIIAAIGHPSTLRAGERWLAHAPFALFAGWLTAASVVGTSSAALTVGLGAPDPRGLVYASLAVGAIAVIGAVVARVWGGLIYAGAIAWAAAATAVKNAAGGDLRIAALAGGAGLLVMVAAATGRKRA